MNVNKVALLIGWQANHHTKLTYATTISATHHHALLDAFSIIALLQGADSIEKCRTDAADILLWNLSPAVSPGKLCSMAKHWWHLPETSYRNLHPTTFHLQTSPCFIKLCSTLFSIRLVLSASGASSVSKPNCAAVAGVSTQDTTVQMVWRHTTDPAEMIAQPHPHLGRGSPKKRAPQTCISGRGLFCGLRTIKHHSIGLWHRPQAPT